mgnify:CR=1 FL=1
MFRLTSALGAFALLSACGVVTGDYGIVSTPGRFAHLSCEDLRKQHLAASEAEQKQVGVMENVMNDPAGFFVNVFVYSSPLASKRGDLQRIEEQARLSNCDLPAPKTAAAVPPG